MKHPKEKKIKRRASAVNAKHADIPSLQKQFWQTLSLLRAAPKKMVTLRLDQDIVDWFKQHGKGYQSEINAILRAYVHSCLGKHRP